ncbi:hypothetical protein LX16_1787 [Stackebrandtia albiflava]|uniref:Glyoxalase-like protein n=1 Tax=Stackebrandtia albiflava TaxID=406432 RepID=A0A562VDX6_9ACTN|nr:hypothetical protein [Stackebrandtia albiflava]TWJ16065.1 hypothetical protein LX16_1787 [Stackebrandtia albiflava]
MTSIDHITLQVPDPVAAGSFPETAFGLGDRIRVGASQSPTTGFRGFALSLVVAQPGTVDALVASALDAGATTLKPVTRSFWGYGGVIRDPGGAIWKIASSSKKDTGPVTRDIDDVVLLLGVDDVAVTRRFYTERGLTVAKSFGRKYVEFATSPVKLALYGRRAAAKDAGVPPEGTGSHRIVIGGAAAFTDPDGFEWEAARTGAVARLRARPGGRNGAVRPSASGGGVEECRRRMNNVCDRRRRDTKCRAASGLTGAPGETAGRRPARRRPGATTVTPGGASECSTMTWTPPSPPKN